MNKIYLGSKNPIKLLAVKDVFNEYEVIACNADSLIGSQPKTIEETIAGAYNRAKALKEDGLRIGLEAGVTIINNKCYLINFGALIDGEEVFYAGGTFIPLPDEIKDMLFLENVELKDAMEKFIGIKDINKKEGTIGYLTNDMVCRYDIFNHICRLLLGQKKACNK